MSCCGERRSAAAAASPGEPAPPARRGPAGPPPGLAYRAVNLHYLREAPVRVTGTITRRAYEFSGASPVASVDARDVPGLLLTGQFRRGR
ncbi:MAG TPA: hypothetical protein VFA33_10550 [Bryobacteraceae bacterium]|nr:hypothetical protein [Bryobacteraceae bacterium]